MSKFGAPPVWKPGDPISAAKLNESASRAITDMRVASPLQLTRNGGQVSLQLTGEGYKAAIVRAKVTTAAGTSTPYVVGATPWDGTGLSSAEVFVKIIYPHSVDDDIIIFQPFGGTNQTDPNGNAVTWLEDDISPDVVVQISSVISGAGGKYNGTIYGGVMNDNGTGNLSLPDGLTAGQSCLVLNQDESGSVPTHWGIIGSSYNYAAGVYWGMSTETPPRPTILCTRLQYRIDSPDTLACPAPNVDSAATDSWDRKRATAGNQFGGNPIAFQFVARMGYNPADATPVLGYFYRIATLAADGRWDTISDETFVAANTPDSCSS